MSPEYILPLFALAVSVATAVFTYITTRDRHSSDDEEYESSLNYYENSKKDQYDEK